LVSNVCNFAKPVPGEPALLSLEDVQTLFHEFGHALHGMLSNVTYPQIAGTEVPMDFVEFPAQLFEHWAFQDEVLSRFALHIRDESPIPRDLSARIRKANMFQQGEATVQFLASAFFDMAAHLADPDEMPDIGIFERTELKRRSMPRQISMRHRPAHFQHIFAHSYSAGYYSYLWSAVLDADGFEAFTEAGDIFSPELADRLYRYIYSAGNLRDAAEAYRAFRGRDPSTDALLRFRGLVATRTTRGSAAMPSKLREADEVKGTAEGRHAG